MSVLAAETEITEDNFLLSMSDHIVSIEAIRRIVECGLTCNLLLVDPNIDDVFDIDDATKVKTSESRIIDIGKELAQR